MLVMMPMMRCPPQRSLLHCRTTEPRQDELKNPACPIGPVREVAVIAGGYAEHADHIQSETQPNSFPRDSSEESGQANHMNSNERQTPDPLDLTRFGYGLGFVCDGDSAHETPQHDLAIN